MAIPPLLDALLRAHGPVGHEHLAHDVVRSALAGVAEVETDAIGNLVARRAGDTGAPRLALFAHLDVVGLAVSHIGDDGLLSVHALAPWHAAIAYGQRVEIWTAHGARPGVVALRSADAEKIEWSSLYVDIGARSGEEARELAAPGDPMIPIAPPLELAAGRVSSRSLDNRAGVYVALEVFRRLEGEGVALIAAAHEELGGHGSRVAAHALRPEVAIAIDVTYATDVPGGDAHEAGAHRLGGGVAIFRGPTVHPRVYELLVEAARDEGISTTVETGSKTATDADSVFASGNGIPCGVVSIPLRNMHSPIEIVELADLEACVRLVVAFARLLEPGASFAR
ncbi:MAG: M20/M25/M40 family metallo-hydrolase [Actinobacteria bacterium]|nr:M20/M25/M40 family metallo-hydrolase [Actinomycetota bacterium]